MNTLTQIHADIDARVQAISDDNADWLCRMGCDSCCRWLAEIPRLTVVEWALLRNGLAALPSEQLLEIGRGIAALAEQTSRPLTCPMLDQSLGVCRVYAHRPVACRTYGFYVQRDKGLYCTDIEARVAKGDWTMVVWGNHDVIDRQLNALGDSRDLTEWFTLWQES
jgi:Fe-S-cluster containining protein